MAKILAFCHWDSPKGSVPFFRFEKWKRIPCGYAYDIKLCHFVTAFLFFFLLIFLGFSCANAQDKFGFPETTSRIAIIADQLPAHMTKAQIRFAATHYVGSQKLTLNITKRLRRYNPKFVVLHYHLGIWQQQPAHQFIIDGKHWGNDWKFVNQHESWFWHNEKGKRVRSRIDGKYLMNIANRDFQNYWKKSIAHQIIMGQYQAVFLDSSSPALLQWEASYADPRLARDAVMWRRFKELKGLTWSEAYAVFMSDLTAFLEFLGFATLPNIGALCTTWDTTDYYTTASGAFMEGAFDTHSVADWKMAMERTLRLIKQDKIIIFQSYIRNHHDYEKRMYYLACYLLIKGRYCYLNYFTGSTLSWYPEWNLDLGKPFDVYVDSLQDLMVGEGLYHRKYEKGEVWVNIAKKSKTIHFEKPVFKVVPHGGGPVNKKGEHPGHITLEKVTKVTLKPWNGLVVLYRESFARNDEEGVIARPARP